MSRALLTAEQVAKLLGVSTAWVYEQSRRGRIPTVTLGRYRRYRAEAIADWLERIEAAGGSRSIADARGVGALRIKPRRASSSARE
ncbi:MAG: helix-turn-helix domain-containing protein [Solirubrobacterales bacterium]